MPPERVCRELPARQVLRGRLAPPELPERLVPRELVFKDHKVLLVPPVQLVRGVMTV